MTSPDTAASTAAWIEVNWPWPGLGLTVSTIAAGVARVSSDSRRSLAPASRGRRTDFWSRTNRLRNDGRIITGPLFGDTGECAQRVHAPAGAPAARIRSD